MTPSPIPHPADHEGRLTRWLYATRRPALPAAAAVVGLAGLAFLIVTAPGGPERRLAAAGIALGVVGLVAWLRHQAVHDPGAIIPESRAIGLALDRLIRVLTARPWPSATW